MKIRIERECCQKEDRKKYNGYSGKYDLRKLYFCVYCGQLWIDRDEGMIKVFPGKTDNYVEDI